MGIQVVIQEHTTLQQAGYPGYGLHEEAWRHASVNFGILEMVGQQAIIQGRRDSHPQGSLPGFFRQQKSNNLHYLTVYGTELLGGHGDAPV